MVTFKPTLFTALVALYMTSLTSASAIPVAGGFSRYDDHYNDNSNFNSNINNNQNTNNNNHQNINNDNNYGYYPPAPDVKPPILRPVPGRFPPFDNSNSNSNSNNNQNTNNNNNYNGNYGNEYGYPPAGLNIDKHGTEDSTVADIPYRPKRPYGYRVYSRPDYYQSPPVATAAVQEIKTSQIGKRNDHRDDDHHHHGHHHDDKDHGSKSRSRSRSRNHSRRRLYRRCVGKQPGEANEHQSDQVVVERGRQLERRRSSNGDSPDTSPDTSPSRTQERKIRRRNEEGVQRMRRQDDPGNENNDSDDEDNRNPSNIVQTIAKRNADGDTDITRNYNPSRPVKGSDSSSGNDHSPSPGRLGHHDHHHQQRCCLHWAKCHGGRPGEKYAYGRRYCCYKWGKCPDDDEDGKGGKGDEKGDKKGDGESAK